MTRVHHSTSRCTRAVLAAAVMLLLVAAPVAAWPDRPVRITTLAGVGGGPDAALRVLAEGLAKRWGQPVVVDNRPGADGIVSVQAFLGASDKDHALLFSSTSTVTVNPLLHASLPYDPVRDLAPISFVIEDFLAVVAAPTLSANSLAELVALARTKPRELNYASVPGAPYLAFRALQKVAAIEMTFVAYKNPFGAIPDLIEGRISVAILPLASVLGQARTGKLKILAVSNHRRSPMAPEVPTALEAGYPDFAFFGGLGLFGARSTRSGLLERIAADTRAVLQEREVGERLTAIGFLPHGTSPASFAALLQEQSEKWAAIARASGVRPAQ